MFVKRMPGRAGAFHRLGSAVFRQACIEKFEAMTPNDELPDFDSFFVGVVSPGDIISIPAGFLVCQKVVNKHSTGIKVPSHVLSGWCTEGHFPLAGR